ncbi:glutathione S-transferase family protein [Novosphingobium sp.]|uniref:glutathione S-transferase family protein n=1 Tax=Novosphingobium sp. TaxID=1874826 RepID=UPI00286E57DB|nr:glutathione S-transferase family protein [Novosphingobium sp.]
MSQPELVLYHFPGACSQVAVCALELAGLEYRLELVNLAVGEQTTPGYLAVNPLGKVPLLLIDGDGLSENAAILTYVSELRPDAGLFPARSDPRMRAEAIGGMSFCGGTLHPIVRGLANPGRLTNGDGAPVREKSNELANKSFKQAEIRLANCGWWLGEWSIVDVYLNWAFGVARNAGFDSTPFPLLDSLHERLAEQSAFVRMMEIEAASRSTLANQR